MNESKTHIMCCKRRSSGYEMETNMSIKTFFLGILLIMMISIVGCYADQAGNQTGNASVKVTIGDILNTADSLSGKIVSVEGKITQQCGSGCWFIISDESGDLYVDLKPNNFVIPPAMGKKVTVVGSLITKDNDVTLIGSTVDVEGKQYP